MGNDSKKIQSQFNPDEWKEIGIHRQIVKIVQSTKGLGQAQLQTIPLDPRRNLQKQLQIYQYRKTSDNALVKCLGVTQQKSKSSSLCGSNQALKVLTERIPLRLNQLPQLSFNQSVYALIQSLRGYKDCYNKLGAFDVDSQMIGVNNQGDVKVWVSDNFAQNHPLVEKPLLQTSGGVDDNRSKEMKEVEEGFMRKNDQTDMVRNVMQVVQKKCQFGRFPQNFADAIYKKPLTFDEAFKSIENFSRSNNLFIPDRLMVLKKNLSGRDGYFVPSQMFDRPPQNPPQRTFHQQGLVPNPASTIHPPIIPNQQSSTIPTSPAQNNISSPIKVLFQDPTQKQRILSPRQLFPSSGAKTNPQGSKITFRMVSPQTSTLSFRNNPSMLSNRS